MQVTRVVLLALVPALTYVAIFEALYQWYELGFKPGSGTGAAFAGIFAALLSAPGDVICGYECTRWFIGALGYDGELPHSEHQRWVEFHAPAYALAMAMFVASAFIGVVGKFLSGRRNGRHDA